MPPLGVAACFAEYEKVVGKADDAVIDVDRRRPACRGRDWRASALTAEALRRTDTARLQHASNREQWCLKPFAYEHEQPPLGQRGVDR